MTKSEIKNYRAQIMGCWLGKVIGGTLGQPFEGQEGPHNVDFYTPVPDKAISNDDLDLQVLWAVTLDRMSKPEVNRHVLANAFSRQDFPWAEYGVAIRNMSEGLAPPLSGAYDNWYIGGMGAAIRSEIWACLAAGNPELAAAYAYEDACIDHADEGIWAEIFLSALESAAFVESDTDKLLDIALSYLPKKSVIRKGVEQTRLWWQKHSDWLVVRELILQKYRHESFTYATMNIPFFVLGWLAGQGDFSKAICISTNCGQDSDCTAATVGALMGIVNPDCIPEKWLKPIGHKIIYCPFTNIENPPKDLYELTSIVVRLRERLNMKPPASEEEAIPSQFPGIHAHIAFTHFSDDIALIDHGWMVPPGSKAPEMPDSSLLVKLSGTIGRMRYNDFKDDVLLLRYRIIMADTRKVRLMLNSKQNCRVWLDGVYQFGRESGRMEPSPHFAPIHQRQDLELNKGTHDILVALKRPLPGQTAEWVVGVADQLTMKWIPGVFCVPQKLE